MVRFALCIYAPKRHFPGSASFIQKIRGHPRIFYWLERGKILIRSQKSSPSPSSSDLLVSAINAALLFLPFSSDLIRFPVFLPPRSIIRHSGAEVISFVPYSEGDNLPEPMADNQLPPFFVPPWTFQTFCASRRLINCVSKVPDGRRA